jgi:hypothetical protein
VISLSWTYAACTPEQGLSCGAGITSANHALRCSNHRQADRQGANQERRHADRYAGHADRYARQADRQADRHARQADRHARQARIKEFVSFVRSLFPLLADHISIYWM